MMDGMTLTEFLLARIAEDEASMRGILEMDARTDRDPKDFGKYVVDPVIGPYGGQSPRRDVARGLHLARFGNPTRVLADCEAKRRMIRRALAAEDAMGDEVDDQTYFIRLACRDAWLLALSDLALPYDDHPDYREEWRP